MSRLGTSTRHFGTSPDFRAAGKADAYSQDANKAAGRAMINELDPRVNQWYMHHGKGEMFRIVATDTATGNVQIQYFGGDIEEIERDAWHELDIEAAAAPEDWTGPYDDIDPDTLDMTDSGMRPRLVWRVIETFGNVSWPSGLDRLH